MIVIKNLKLGYIKEFYALYDINLKIKSCQKIAIIGDDNSGKTSLLRILAKLQKATSGEITINDIPLEKLDYSIDLSVAFLSTMPILFNNRSVKQNIDYVLKIRKFTKKDTINLVENILREFDLITFKDTKVKYLSLYEKRLLQFAMISIREKIDLLLIDDILEDLNSEQSKKIFDLVNNFSNRNGTTTIFATKNDNIAHDFTNVIYKLKLGSLENKGIIDE